MSDPREQPLNEVARRIMVASNYDPHFSGIEERLIMETKLFLARWDALQKLIFELNRDHAEDAEYLQKFEAGSILQVGDDRFLRLKVLPDDPIPMVLFCPNCGVQHIDAEEPHKPDCYTQNMEMVLCNCGRWTNPPHRSHACHYCQHVWRPADVPTTGVLDISTRGKADTPEPVRGTIDTVRRFRPEWRHKVLGTPYIELGRGELQLDTHSAELTEGSRMIAYKGDDNRVWFRLESQFIEWFERVVSR